MALSLAVVTVSVVEVDTKPTVTVITVDPVPARVARPPLLMLATARLEEFHDTPVVSVAGGELSDRFPVGVNCRDPLESCSVGLAGVSVMESNTAATVTLAVAVIPPQVAVMLGLPAATPVTKPVELTVASDVFEDFQTALSVTSCDVPFEYAADAESCCHWLTPIEGLAGDTVTPVSVAPVTVTGTLADTSPTLAVT